MALFNHNDSFTLTEGAVSVTINGKKIDLIEVEEANAKVTLNKEEQRALGSFFVGNKTTGIKGTGTLNVKMVSSMWMKIVADFANGKGLPDMTLTGVMESSTSSAKKQVVALNRFLPDEVELFKLAASDGVATNEMGFTFDSFTPITTFNDIKR